MCDIASFKNQLCIFPCRIEPEPEQDLEEIDTTDESCGGPTSIFLKH